MAHPREHTFTEDPPTCASTPREGTNRVPSTGQTTSDSTARGAGGVGGGGASPQAATRRRRTAIERAFMTSDANVPPAP